MRKSTAREAQSEEHAGWTRTDESWLEPGKATIGFVSAEWDRAHGTLLYVQRSLSPPRRAERLFS
jgi:hypothetical protein